MLAQAARAGARAVARKARIGGGKSYSGVSAERSYASTASHDGKSEKRSSGVVGKVLGGLALLAGGIYLGDLYMNDDLDNISEAFRSRLSDEERKDRYVHTSSIDSDRFYAMWSKMWIVALGTLVHFRKLLPLCLSGLFFLS